MVKITRRLLVVFPIVLGCLGADAKADTLRTVALTGGSAPGTTADFLDFFSMRLNDAGQVAFLGYLLGASTNNRGIWAERNGALALVARTGNIAPGTGVNFSLLNSPLFNNAGHVAFIGGRIGSSTDDKGIWSNASGSLALVTREGNNAPGTDENYSGLGGRSGNLVLNDAGQVAFRGHTSENGSIHEGIWSTRGGPLTLIARRGVAAPGTDVNFSSFQNPVFNNLGQTAFSARLVGGELARSNNEGIWAERNGALALVVREGDAAPGTSVNFFDSSIPVLNNAGQIAFRSGVLGPGVDGSNRRGIWSEGTGSLALVVREGDGAPGTSNDFSFLYPPVFNDAGQTAFSATFGSGGLENSGIWSERGGSLELVARAGETAPGTHATFSHFARLTPALNNAGRVAFSRHLAGPEVNAINDWGIWAEDALGKLTLIARGGDQLDVSDGPVPDLRTISGLSFDANGFNDLGQVAFYAVFTDGTSGVFVSNLVAVPEPSSLALLSMIGIGLLSGGRGPRGGGLRRGARSVGR